MAFVRMSGGGGSPIKERKLIIETTETTTPTGSDLRVISNNITVGASGNIHFVIDMFRFVYGSGYTYTVTFKKNNVTVQTRTFSSDGNYIYEIDDTCDAGDNYAFTVNDSNMKVKGYYYID